MECFGVHKPILYPNLFEWFTGQKEIQFWSNGIIVIVYLSNLLSLLSLLLLIINLEQGKWKMYNDSH